MILAFLHLEDEPKLTKFTYGFSKYLSDITSTILFSQFSDDLNTSTIREVINAKNVKSFKNNKFFVNNIESTKTLETELSLNKINLLKKLVQTFAFLVYESDLEKTSWMQDLKLDLVFIFINLDKMQMDDIYQSLNYLLNVFRTYKIQSKIVFISYCLNSSDSVFTNFLGLKNSFNQYMFNEIIIFSEKNYEKSKKFYNQLLQIIKQ